MRSRATPARLPARWLIAGIVTIALLQTAALAKMVTDRAALLRNGIEVVLETGAIDPRDLFRGHYAILNLAISVIDVSGVSIDPALAPGMPAYVTLRPGPDLYWQPEAVHATLPDGGGPVLRGHLDYRDDRQLFLSFPFDRYFAPQDRALELERLDRAGRMGVILALDGQGQGPIKGLMIDEALIYEEPLF
jgi:uncharacterized membrane-anchored protein